MIFFLFGILQQKYIRYLCYKLFLLVLVPNESLHCRIIRRPPKRNVYFNFNSAPGFCWQRRYSEKTPIISAEHYGSLCFIDLNDKLQMPGEITSYPKKESSSSKHDIFRFFCFSRFFFAFLEPTPQIRNTICSQLAKNIQMLGPNIYKHTKP